MPFQNKPDPLLCFAYKIKSHTLTLNLVRLKPSLVVGTHIYIFVFGSIVIGGFSKIIPQRIAVAFENLPINVEP